MNKLQIPNRAVPYILYQRTTYLEHASNPFYRAFHKFLPDLSYKSLVTLESNVNREKIQSCYEADLESDFETLEAHLPAVCPTWLDIGCGVAGIDVLIWEYYQKKAGD